MLWNFYGFMHYNNEDVPSALASFEKVIAEEAIPKSLRLSTMRSVGQLNMAQENYTKALEYLTMWRDASKKDLTAADHVLFAQNYYQTKQYSLAVESIEQAVSLYEAKDKLPKENWLVLQRAAYYELKQPLKVTDVLEKMVRLYNKPEHWVQLAGMYGETEQEIKQLAVMEAAWQAGYITKGQDMVTLAQLYMYHEVPFKAAMVLEQAMKEGKINKVEKNLQLVSQAYLMAKNDDLAVNPLKEAADVAEHGNFEAQLAEIYVNTEQWEKAIDMARVALRKGELTNPGNIHMALGMAHYNLNKYDESLFALSKAKLFQPTKRMASQWITYVSKEQDLQAKRTVF
jgi:tetratricopeptide (TPR) repeat protein